MPNQSIPAKTKKIKKQEKAYVIQLARNMLNTLFFLLALFSILLTVGFELDLTKYRHTINQQLTQTLGRELAVNGHIILTLSWTPHVQLSDITLADADPSMPPMMSAGRLEAKAAILPLITGHIKVLSADLVNIQLSLNKDMDGHPNWQFEGDKNTTAPDSPMQSSPSPQLPFRMSLSEHIHLKNIQINYADTAANAFFDWELTDLTVIPQDGLWSVTAFGHTAGYPYHLNLSGEIENLINLQMAELAINGEFASAHLKVNATIDPLLRQDSLININLKWEELSAVETLLGLDINQAAPLSLQASMVLNSQSVNINKLFLTSPVAEASGSLKLTQGEHNTIDGQLHIPFLNLQPWVHNDPDNGNAFFGAEPVKSPLQLMLDQWLVHTSTGHQNRTGSGVWAKC